MHLQFDLVVRQIFSDSFLPSARVEKDFQGLVMNHNRTGIRLKISVRLRDHTVIQHSFSVTDFTNNLVMDQV